MFGSKDGASDELKRLIGVPDYQPNLPLPNGEGLVNIPRGNTTIKTSLINPITFGPSKIERFMSPPVPGLDEFNHVPSYSFLLQHPTGRNLVWDLGIREDYENYAPSVASYIPSTGYTFKSHGSVADQLVRQGISLDSVEAVIWSHWHWDHIGSPETFPPSTALIVGAGFKEGLLPGAPTNPKSPVLESAWSGRELIQIDFKGPNATRIGQFPAVDYFGDGSLYLLHSPGHAIGHLCALVRTTTSPDTFVLLGGDVCHYSGIMRPSVHLPIPDEISPHPILSGCASFCPGEAFEALQESRGRAKVDTLYDMTFGYDIPLAQDTVKKLQELDVQENVFVIIAHDTHVGRIVDHFPGELNQWKAKGWGKRSRWAFLKDMEIYWKSKGLIE